MLYSIYYIYININEYVYELTYNSDVLEKGVLYVTIPFNISSKKK